MLGKVSRRKTPRVDVRPVVELSPQFLILLEEAIQNLPGVRASFLGIYEGRRLRGDYKLRITAARLAPVPAPPKTKPQTQ